MRKLIVAVGVLAVLAGVVRAEDIELDMDLMHTIEDTNKSLASNIATQNQPGSTADAKELVALFGQVETYFVTKGGADDAVDLSRKSRDLADSIVKSVADKQFDAATEAATSISRTCRTCHTFYKKS